MILKQNSFIITDNELDALEQGFYKEPTRVVSSPAGLQVVEQPITYTGSSIQRRNYKAKKTITQEIADCKILLRKKDLTETEFNRLERRLHQLETLRELKNDKKEPIQHELSKRSKTKIAQKILAWAHASKHNESKPRYTFLTLTLTSKQIGNDSEFTKMQNVFFTYCRKYFNLNNYLYVLEKQKNGNTHSHVLIDTPLPIKRLNYIWCKILGDHGYTFASTDSRTGITQTLNVNEALKAYQSSPIIPGQPMGKMRRYVTSPNPADIRYIYNLKAVTHYITKYITKNETKINTTIWNCSQSISRLWVGAKISALKYYSPLREQITKIIRQTLDEGHVLNICLLKYYTKIQDEIFTNVNRQYLVT